MENILPRKQGTKHRFCFMLLAVRRTGGGSLSRKSVTNIGQAGSVPVPTPALPVVPHQLNTKPTTRRSALTGPLPAVWSSLFLSLGFSTGPLGGQLGGGVAVIRTTQRAAESQCSQWMHRTASDRGPQAGPSRKVYRSTV